jgi:hypothetical protein
MKDEFVRKLAMYGRVRDYLQTPANKTRWFNQKPKASGTLAAQFETEAGMDDLAPQFAVNPNGTVNADGKLFVDGYFNARRIGAAPVVARKQAEAAPRPHRRRLPRRFLKQPTNFFLRGSPTDVPPPVARWA